MITKLEEILNQTLKQLNYNYKRQNRQIKYRRYRLSV